MTDRCSSAAAALDCRFAGTKAGMVMSALAGVVASAVTSSAFAATSGANGAHDPSRMIESDGKVYVYSTGGGGASSPDGLVWTAVPTPPWNRSLANNQGIWAPDGLFLNGQYYLYGSMWSPAKDSAIVLLTTPSLDPSSPSSKWTDRGVAIAGPVGVTHSVIDPAPTLDAAGNLWVSWGGGYPFPTTANSIFVTRMDNTTGLPLTSDPGWKPPDSPGYPIAQGHREGSYVHYHAQYYYFFWQTGSCCSGASSTYKINVSRSQSITGPYTGDQVFYAGTGSIHGPGHIGIYSACGVERFTDHYYPNSGGSVIGENELQWSATGWPVVGPESTTPFKPCATATGDGGTGATAGSGGADSSVSGPDTGTMDTDAAGTAGGSSGTASASGASGGGTSGDGTSGTGSGGASASSATAGTLPDAAVDGAGSSVRGGSGTPSPGQGGCAVVRGVAGGQRWSVLSLLGAALAVLARRWTAIKEPARLHARGRRLDRRRLRRARECARSPGLRDAAGSRRSPRARTSTSSH
ncbi:MAG: family 43 glycosylhydrolase [Myxococcota bacterium]|nr:family 43 glycosylhydrolase [Myxococcota bacterium]